MKVFISWSGDKSKAVAELLKDWLQCVIQAVEPWMSNKDLDKGSLWFNAITGQFQDTCLGIICLTKVNKDRPWILFEAGSIAKGLSDSRVYTLLIDLAPTDLENPLAQFHATIPDKEGIRGLITSLNTHLGDNALKEQILDQVFETYWPQFESKFNKIKSITEEGAESTVTRSENDILAEILSTTRSLDKRIRNLEINNIETALFNKNTLLKWTEKDAENFVMSKLNNGEFVDVIEKELVRMGVPGNLAKNIIYERLHSLPVTPGKGINEIKKGEQNI